MRTRRRTSTFSPSNSMLTQLRGHYRPVTPPSSRISIPRGWRIKEVLRADGSRSDTYYCEPETGRKFRSIKEVQRYLNGEIPRKSPKKFASRIQNRENKMVSCGGKMVSLDYNEDSGGQMAIVAFTKASFTAPFTLPDGWIVESVPRKHSPHCDDKYYYEPETGHKFRSIKEVQRYLNGEKPQKSPQKFSSHSQNRENKMVSCGGKMASLDYKEDSGGQMAIVAFTKASTTSHVTLPDGWIVESVPRKHSPHCQDKYYYEPETGRKFRSIKEVQRYLNGEKPRKSPQKFSPHSQNRENKMVSCGRKMVSLDDNEDSGGQMAIVAFTKASITSPFTLPDGWIVESVPRKHSPHCDDKYYYEPGTGKKFRSLVSVERYLAEENIPLSKMLEGIREIKHISKIRKLQDHPMITDLKLENTSKESAQDSSFASPPVETSWVLASPQGNAWNPFISGILIPDLVDQNWTDGYNVVMNDGYDNALSSHGQR